MILLKNNFDHDQESINSALNVPKETLIKCRERIFYTHFTNTLQGKDLFSEGDVPRNFTTITGDLERCLSIISDPLEYEVTLLFFMSFHKISTAAFAQWKFFNDPNTSNEDKLKIELLKVVSKLKDSMKSEDDEKEEDSDNINRDLDTDSIMKRIDVVIKSQYNFKRYMELMGFAPKDHTEVDELINGLFE
jgi:hypothetical protein